VGGIPFLHLHQQWLTLPMERIQDLGWYPQLAIYIQNDDSWCKNQTRSVLASI
jgi:hypothetical protein